MFACLLFCHAACQPTVYHVAPVRTVIHRIKHRDCCCERCQCANCNCGASKAVPVPADAKPMPKP